jgi:hypothetical protein
MPGIRGYHKTEWGVTMHRYIQLKCFQNLFEWALGAASARSSIQVNKKAQQELNAFLLRFILKSIS